MTLDLFATIGAILEENIYKLLKGTAIQEF